MGLEGYADAAVLAPFPHAMVRLGAVGRIRALLDEAACRDIVMVGHVRRPSLLTLRPDAEGAKLLARIGRAAFLGDDGLLSAVVRVLGEDGFRVLGAHEVLTEAVAPPGLLTQAAPDAMAAADVARGVAVARLLGEADVGQACVVQQGLVLAVEAIEGTDAMLRRAAGLVRPGPGGVVVKLLKPGQERRADMPAIGPATVALAAEAGLRGIAYAARGTLIAERARTIAAADAARMFLLGLDPETYQPEPEQPA